MRNLEQKQIVWQIKDKLLFYRLIISGIFIILTGVSLGYLCVCYPSWNLFYVGLSVFAFLAIYKSPLIGAFSIVLVALINQYYGYTPYFELGSLNFFLGDVLAVIFSVTILFKLINVKLTSIKNCYLFNLLIIFSSLIVIQILRGLPYYGQTTIVHSRGNIFSITAAVYFSIFPYNKLKLKQFFQLFV